MKGGVVSTLTKLHHENNFRNTEKGEGPRGTKKIPHAQNL